MLNVKQFELKENYKIYQPTKEEEVKVNYIDQRFQKMQSKRSNVDKDWDIYQEMIDAIFEPYPDERSSSTVPLASAIIELYVAETLKIPPQFNVKSEVSDFSDNAKALEYVWKYDWRKNCRKKAFNEAEYITAGFGTSIIYSGFESYNITQKDFTVGDNDEYIWEDRTFKKENIIVKNVDIRNFYIDDQALTSIDEASDCILFQWISFEKFGKFKNSPIYKNIDKITPIQYSNDYNPFIILEEQANQGDFVKLTHYWNVEKDVYMVIANGVLIREHPMITTMDGIKALPFTVIGLGHKNYSIYKRGLCEALLMFNTEINNLREMLMDGIRRSNTQVLAIGNGLKFNGKTFSYDNEIITFDGNLANNFQQLSGNPPNQAIFNYITQIYKDIAIYVGIDIQNIIGEPQQTAFQTEVQREASQKRVNVWLTNRDLALERFANLYKDLLQTYFPRKTAEGLYPIIEVEDEQMQNGKFRKKKGKHTFEVTPELLRGDLYIDVFTNTSAPTINAVDRAQKLELLQTVGQISQGYALAKQAGVDMEKILPIKKTLKDLASDYNLEVSTGDSNEDIEEAKAQLFAEVKGMMTNSQPLPTNPQEQGATL